MTQRFLPRLSHYALLISVTTLSMSVAAEDNPPSIFPGTPLTTSLTTSLTTQKNLFDGKTLSGWKAVSKNTNSESIWSVTNGVIHCLGKPNGYLRTVESYRDYQLHVEWRWPEGPGNSGVFVNLNAPDKVWPLCYEAQLAANNAGELRFNGGALAKNMPTPETKSLPRREPVSEKPIGEWNACEIVCRGDTIAIRINGVLQNEISGASAASGAIALQAEGKPVEFRNITVQPLSKP